VDQQLKAAADRLAGGFRQQYQQLVNDVVAPGAKQQHISAVATVPAAASVSATGKHAVVLVFVDQTTTIGNDAPTQSTSSVRVSLDKVDGRWLVSQFDPV
jgi:Mce-associated membrane protein